MALGDSFASGEGAYNYKLGTDLKNPLNKCHLSLRSYPYLIGQQANLDQFESVACSGAKIKDIIGVNGNYTEDDAQSKGMDPENDSYTNEILNNFLVGYRIQNQFIEKYKPSTATISIGGNDIDFGGIVAKCTLWQTTCFQTQEERLKLVLSINARFNDLVRTYTQLQQNTTGTVYVVGYPSMVDPEGNCAANVHSSKPELYFYEELVTYLNQVIEKATKRSGAVYVNVQDAFINYRLCEQDSANLAVNGRTAGNDKFLDIGPIGKESYHPNAKGHELFAKKIMSETQNFTKKPSLPDKSIAHPTLSDGNDLLLDPITPSYGSNYESTAPKISIDDLMSSDLLPKNTPNQIKSDKFAPNTPVSVDLYSTPTKLGSYTANNQGELDASITIPNDIEPGYHTLHLFGVNRSGEAVDRQKTVYVAETLEDIDGDSIPNESEKCLTVEPSNTDRDQDGIDDACDPVIDAAPVQIPGDPEDEIVPLPPIQNPPDQADEILKGVPSGETVAGNELLVNESEATISSVETAVLPQTVAQTIVSNIARSQAVIVSDSPVASDEGSVQSEDAAVSATSISKHLQPQEKQTQNAGSLSIVWVISGLSAGLFIVVFLVKRFAVRGSKA
jgi:lysophospholipase L1-like esterase